MRFKKNSPYFSIFLSSLAISENVSASWRKRFCLLPKRVAPIGRNASGYWQKPHGVGFCATKRSRLSVEAQHENDKKPNNRLLICRKICTFATILTHFALHLALSSTVGVMHNLIFTIKNISL